MCQFCTKISLDKECKDLSILFTYFIKDKTNSIKNEELHFNSHISAIYSDLDFWMVAFFWGKRIIFLRPEILKVFHKGVRIKWSGPQLFHSMGISGW